MSIDDVIHPKVPDKHCPECERATVRVGTVTSHVTYYRCDACGHVWPEPLSPGRPTEMS